MKLLVFAHTPPPHHGQSYMVKLLLEGLGRETRRRESARTEEARTPSAPASAADVHCYHVNCRLSEDLADIGTMRPGKVFHLLAFCAQAWWGRFRHGAKYFYYIPAPAVRSPLYRDWIVMALCRPFFSRVIFHLHAIGLGGWLETQATPFERWLTRKLLFGADLCIVLGPFYQADACKLQPQRIQSVPNGIPDPCPQFEAEGAARRAARRRARVALLAGQSLAAREVAEAGGDPELFHVLYLNHCIREKGLFDTVEAVALLHQRLTSARAPVRVRLHVAGRFWHEPDREEFERRIAAGDLTDTALPDAPAPVVKYHGFVEGDAKRRLFMDSDCYCFPTYYASEGQPVSLIEALAFDLPVVTTRWRALPDFFPEGYPGLVEPRAPVQVATAVELMMRQPPSVDFRRLFLEHYTEEKFISNLKAALVGLA